MTWVDAVVVALLLGAAWSGLRRGFISSTVSLVGAVGGAVVAIRLAPLAMDRVDDAAAKVAVGIACVILGVGVGEWAGTVVGRALADRITWRPAQALDRGLGLVGHTVAVTVVVWLVAVPLASITQFPWLASSVRSSAVLQRIDAVMPDGATAISDRMRALFDQSGFPAILDPLAPTPDTAVAAPDPADAATAGVRAAGRSVLKVRGQAPSCQRGIEGSGFVIGPERLMTNAHVVAGTTTVGVEQGGRLLPATVVVYDPERDVAVLDVPGLRGDGLRWDTALADTGIPAVAAGYPLDGPYTVSPGRVQSELTLRGPDIYQASTVSRQVYTLRIKIRSGNSGGPLLGTDGRVLGVVFGASIDKPDVGFALTATEVAPVLAEGLAAPDTAVGTGACAVE
ncbi:MarP family serine protease [Nakamurella endophytica]|uniref:Serine protease n=1 Tax=Nakamurella endophytica TaxID=1748367 RepID=A0A917WHI5_9ACTN|nr:MarP family serine protease [Nakamurella endophytica]GGM05405.1 serine protease [Nakamurella endophytica]